MKQIIEGVLYTDVQQETRTDRCEVCGGLCYWPGYYCIRCGRDRL